MTTHPALTEWILDERLNDVRGELRQMRRGRDARLVAGPPRLASSGPRATLARWVSRSLLRAEPCIHEPAESIPRTA